jgi:secreted PhoX family phosphatase
VIRRARITRRAVLQGGGAAALGAIAGCAGGAAQPISEESVADAPSPLPADPQGILELPEGFTYQVLSRTGDRMHDGYRTPGRPDAMGCFEGADGTIVLMRNHEVFRGDVARSPYFPDQQPPTEAYDPEGTGGVTRLVLDPETLAVRSSNLVLAGTFWNCAGGLSPWGWLTCEETVDPGHGYVFICATDAERVSAPQRIPAYGRMRHEAATVDPATMIAYLTEDQGDACFYRFVPSDPSKPFVGTLQALRITSRPAFDTGALRAVDEPLVVDWVDIDQPDSEQDDVRLQGQAKGAALFRRTEGMWLAGDQVFLTATVGGPISRGQILRLTLGEQSTLEVVAEATDPDALDMPDNLCVSPDGMLYVAEDGLGGNFLRRVRLDGSVVPFARNALSIGEMAGPCFSPDGRTLFVNLQEDGLTIAIRGPFERELASERALHNSDAGTADIDWGRGARGLGTGLAVLAMAALARRRRTRVP